MVVFFTKNTKPKELMQQAANAKKMTEYSIKVFRRRNYRWQKLYKLLALLGILFSMPILPQMSFLLPNQQMITDHRKFVDKLHSAMKCP